MQWLLFTGLVLDAAGASLLFLSDLPVRVKQTVYKSHPWILETEEISMKLYEAWSTNSGKEFYFRNISYPQMNFIYNVLKYRRIASINHNINGMRYKSPHLIFLREDGPDYATPCYDSPRRMFERRLEVAVTQHFSKFGALLLLAGFTLQAISVVV
ncbi:hypothetical protein [Halorussus amylolyticus]|uniref:hypothetical protein n=1 Tax=Halorussus amylolyticus TaxID=1126242 RepID=UPI00104C292A|nr:hypothetical protein [Halorussus amylolyticus]